MKVNQESLKISNEYSRKYKELLYKLYDRGILEQFPEVKELIDLHWQYAWWHGNHIGKGGSS